MDEIVIVGSGPAYDGDCEEVWGVGQAIVKGRLTRIYATDEPDLIRTKYADYFDTANATGVPFYYPVEIPEIENYVELPLAEILAEFGMTEDSTFFTSTVSYMIASAVMERPKLITIWGINAWPAAADYFQQDGCLNFWLGVAIGRGIPVQIGAGSKLLQPYPWMPRLYGYWRESKDGKNLTSIVSNALWACSKILPHIDPPSERIPRGEKSHG